MPSTGNTALKMFVRPEPIQRHIALPEPQPLRLVDLPKGGRVTILHLSDKTCKWPIGDPGSEDFCFCGHSPRDKSPYCEYHARAAYQPMQDRRHRKFG
jgi:GcrA cell cycle regulator